MTVSMVVPGSSARMLAKAVGLEADEIVLDLEDAVLPAAKEPARELVRAAVGGLPQTVAVRVNEVGSRWILDDVVALVTADTPPASLVIPKVESPDDVAFLHRLLDGLEQTTGRPAPRLQLLLETAKGIRHIDAILAASARTSAVVLGYADLAASLGSQAFHPSNSAAWTPYQTAVVSAARAAGVRPIDGPFLALDDPAGLTLALTQARQLGFVGSWTIHPAQLGPAHAAFTPTPAEIAAAQQLLATLENSADGTLRHEGRMVDEAVAKSARELLARVARP